MSLSRRQFERILIIKPSSLGDVVHALPVLHGLRKRYPQAQIDWLVADGFAPLIEHHPDISELVLFDRRRFGRMLSSPSSARAFAAFCLNLRRRTYDLVIDLQGLFRSGFLSLVTGAAVRIGFAKGREFSWLFYTHRIPASAQDTHAVDRNYQVAKILGFAEVPVTFDLAVTTEERREAAEMLNEAGLADGERFAAILPGARWDTKRWSEERFAAVADKLRDEQGLRPLLLAGKDEIDVCDRIAALGDQPPLNLAGRTSLRTLIAVLERADVVLCHDSAPMHLAAALNRPMVSIIGPTNPARTGPYGGSGRVVKADWPCMPCYLRRLSQCRHQHRCMTAISTAEVLEAVRGL